MQNKINPLAPLLILILIFLISLILLKKSNIEVINLNNQLNQFKILSSEYSNLKTNWDNKKVTLETLDKILVSSNISNVNKVIKNKIVTIKFENSSVHKIDKFVNKILNSNFNILKFEITQNSVDLEIGY